MNKNNYINPYEANYLPQYSWGGFVDFFTPGRSRRRREAELQNTANIEMEGRQQQLMDDQIANQKELMDMEHQNRLELFNMEQDSNQKAMDHTENMNRQMVNAQQDAVYNEAQQQYKFRNGGVVMGNNDYLSNPIINDYSNGQYHEGPNGGIPIDKYGTPSKSSSNKTIGLTQKGEISWANNGKTYIFSNDLKYS